LKDRGDISWEYHIVETERMLWKIDSIVPPGNGTLAEKRWAREGRATSMRRRRMLGVSYEVRAVEQGGRCVRKVIGWRES
jgi:hypothetical protein